MPSPNLRRVVLLTTLLLLLVLAWTGLYGGFNLLALIVASGIIRLLRMAQA